MNPLLIRRRGMMMAQQGGLPQGYTRLTAIKSDGNAFINLGDYAQIGDVFEFKYKQDAIDSSYRNIIGGVLSGLTGGFFMSQTSTRTFIANVAYYNNQIPLDLYEHTVQWTLSSSTGVLFYVDGVGINLTVAITTINSPTCLFARNASNGKMKGEIFFLSQTRNSDIIHNLVAAIRDADQVLGMYDLITNTFYTNAGSGSFTAII